MANLILPSRFTQQPQYPVKLDTSNPLAIGIASYVIPSRALSYPNNEALTPVGTGSIGGSISGLAVKTIAGSHGVQCAADGDSMLQGCDRQVTIAIYRRCTDTTNRGSSLFGFTSSNRVQAHCPWSDGNVYWDYGGTGNRRTTVAYGAKTTNPETLVFQYSDGAESPAYKSVWRNKTLLTSSSTVDINPRNATTDPFYVGSAYNQVGDNTEVYLMVIANRIWSSSEVASFNDNPWQIFRKRPDILYFDVATGGATGTGALSTGVTTASGTGTLTHTGTGSLTSGVTTLSGAGTLTHTGTGALTTSAVTLAGEGNVVGNVTGTGALTTLAATLSGAGVITHTGTGSLTTGNVTLAGEGNVTQAGTQTGTGALTVSAITASGTGTITHTGTGSLQTSIVTLDGAGVLTHTGTGDLTTGNTTVDGEGVSLGTITGTGALTVGAVTVSGYDVLPVAVKPTGGGGTSPAGRKRQKLIIVERVEDVEELLEQVEEIVQAEPKARKLKLSPKKPKQTVQNQPEAAFDWLSYYQAKLDTLRDQQRANALKRQLDKNAEIIRAILAKQEETARLALELQQEEEMMLLLMAA